jgi:hypothetical protein
MYVHTHHMPHKFLSIHNYTDNNKMTVRENLIVQFQGKENADKKVIENVTEKLNDLKVKESKGKVNIAQPATVPQVTYFY